MAQEGVMFHLIIVILVALILVGALLWLFQQLPGVSAEVKQLGTRVVIVIAVICILFYVLNAFGLLGGRDIPVPRVG